MEKKNSFSLERIFSWLLSKTHPIVVCQKLISKAISIASSTLQRKKKAKKKFCNT
jgi:hypothetical protein